MRVLVCGSRHFKNQELMEDVLKQYDIKTLIQGKARGADLLSKLYAQEHGIRVESFPADWDKYGRSAGSIRNLQMLTEGKPDLVVAFPGGKGTANMIMQAKKAGVEVYEVD